MSCHAIIKEEEKKEVQRVCERQYYGLLINFANYLRKNMELERLADEIEDVSDPSSFDKVLVYFEKLQSEAEEYVELLVRTLENREITWEQPWYQVSGTLVKVYKPYYARNEVEAEKFRTDKITKDEHDRINKNWQRFTKKYEVPDKLRLFVAWKNPHHLTNYPKERIRHFIAAYLARGLQRTLQQVFVYIQSYHLREQSDVRVYNEHEKKIIEVCFLHKLDKAPPILSVVLGRHVRGLYKRRTALKSDKVEKRRIKWNIPRAEKFLKGMLFHSKLQLEELKLKNFDKSFWSKLEGEMEIDYTYLHFFWYTYLHTQLFAECDVKLYKLRKKIFKLLRDSSYKIWCDVRWAELLDHFPDGFTVRFLYKTCFSIIRKNPDYIKTPLQDLANFGLRHIKRKHKFINKRLKRLTLNEKGKLQIIKSDVKEQSS